MSLVSASSFVGGVKEYMFRGLQQLPLVLTMTSFVFTITTGSIAHTTMFTGLAFAMPVFTYLSQIVLGKILQSMAPEKGDQWKRSMVDTCNIITDYKSLDKIGYYTQDINSGSVVPSYWITSIGFFFGYIFANAYDTFKEPESDGGNVMGYEKRLTMGLYATISSVLIFILLMVARFTFMSSCEGGGTMGKVLSVFFGILSLGIGVGFYTLSIQCGARSSDMLGILSQILPASATSPSPTVCLAS